MRRFSFQTVSAIVKADARALAAVQNHADYEELTSIVDAACSDVGGYCPSPKMYEELVSDARMAFNDTRDALNADAIARAK